MKNKVAILSDQLFSIEEQLKKLPEGRLATSSAKTEKRVRFYHSKETGKSYIPRENEELVRLLALKRYLLIRQKELTSLVYAETIENRAREVFSRKMDKLLSEDSNYSDVMKKIINECEPNARKWNLLKSEANSYNLEGKVISTLSGIMVRSKSECLIANELQKNGIPFKYEVALNLGERTIYPDFAVLSPKDYKIYFWEHWGLFDKPDYRKSAFRKMSDYAENGIFPDNQLIMTFESEKNPINVNRIAEIISERFM